MMITRRTAFVLGASLGAAIALAGCQTASPALGPGGTIGSISVDVGPLVAQGWGPNAAVVKSTMETALQGAFSGRVQRGGPRLVVRVNSILTPSYVGNSGGGGRFGGGGGNGTNDFFDSESRLLGQRGEILATFPVLSAVSASSSGPWYLQDNDTRRIQTLANHNAGWIARYVLGR